MSRSQANLLLIAVALIWGSAFVAQAHGLETVGPFAFTGIRFLLGACVVAPLAWRDWRDWRHWQAQAVAPRALCSGRDALVGVTGLGCLLTCGALFQQIGMKTTSVTHAGLLTGLYVPLVPLLSWLILRERPHWSIWPAALGCLVGTWMLSGSGATSLVLNVGDAWVVASSVFWALHVIYVGRIAGRLAAPFLVACGQFVVCGLICLACAALFEPVLWQGVREAAWPIVYAGVLSVGVAYTGQVVGQRYADASEAAIILSGEALFAALFGFVLMGDRLDAVGLAGCALIFACIIAVPMTPLAARPR